MTKPKEMKKGTSEMPEPQVLSYEDRYKVTPLFLSDLTIVLGEVAYVEARRFFAMIESYEYVMPIAAINELIRMLSTLPYKYVNSIMNVLGHEENFLKYFEKVGQANPVKSDSENQRSDGKQ